MDTQEASAKFLEDWGLIVFGVIIGTLGLLWLVVEEFRFRRTADSRRRERVRQLIRELVGALEAEDAKGQLDYLRSVCPNPAAFDAAKSEILGRFVGPVYQQHGVDFRWQEAYLPAAASEDAEIAALAERLGALCSFGVLGPLAAAKGRCVAVEGLEGEAAILNGQRGVIKGYSEEKDLYEVTFLLKDVGSVSLSVPSSSLTVLSDQDMVESIQKQMVDVLNVPEIQAMLRTLRSDCQSQSLYLHRREGIDLLVLNPIFERHGVDGKWFTYMVGALAAQNPEIQARATHIGDLLAFSPGDSEEPPPGEAAPRRAPERPPLAERSRLRPRGQLWEVAAGAEGPAVLAGSAERGWAELPARLRPGAVLEELALDGGYLQFAKLTGDGPSGGWVGVAGEGRAAVVKTSKKPLEVWLLCLGTRGDFQPFAALAQGLQRGGYCPRLLGPENQEGLAAACGLPFTPICPDVESAIRSFMERPDRASDFMGDLMFEDFDHELLLHEVELGMPAVLVYSTLCQFWALNVERKFGIPALRADLQPQGLEGCSPGFSEEAFLEASRQTWAEQCHIEDMKVRPAYGVAAVTDMGFERYHRRSHREGHLVGFLASLCDFLHALPPQVAEIQRRHTYTGFWFLDSEDSPDLMEGAEQMGAVESFLAVGPAVYVGWGSCVCAKGPHHMVALAVGALKQAGVRGIVLAGWARLGPELLAEAVGPEDYGGLREYARQNVLFVERVSHSWLLPRCACHVHHGGAGTLAASWRTGRPAIVTPIWLDQFSNAELVKYMCGIATPAVDELTSSDLAGYIKRAMTDLGAEGAARMLALSVQREEGVGRATDYVARLVREEIKSGKWHKRWKATGYGWREDWGMQKYV